MDPLADMLVQIKNAGEAGKKSVVVTYSNFKLAVAQVLLRKGYIAGLAKKGRDPKRTIEIVVAYQNNEPKIKGIKRLSKVSRRLYANARNLRPVRQGKGDLILSTPQGILTGAEARKGKVGGETLFTIW